MTSVSLKRKMGIASFLKDLMRRRKLLPSQLAAELSVSHATVRRWLLGEDIPNTHSCKLLADFSGIPIQQVLVSTGCIPKIREEGTSNWPEFREYSEKKYPRVLDEDMITLIEDLIERKRLRKGRKNWA